VTPADKQPEPEAHQGGSLATTTPDAYGLPHDGAGEIILREDWP